MHTAGWKRFFTTSVGKKQIVGITGLGISLFTLTHMAGNLLLFVGPEAYNTYSHKLVTNPLLPVAELGLVVMFLLHVYYTVQLTLANRAARGAGNSMQPTNKSKGGSLAVRTAILSGLLLLAFVVLHLITFKWGTYYETQYGGVTMRDIYKLVAEKFHEPGYVAWYEFCLLLLGLHLSHGVAATFQSLGIANVRRTPVRRLGLLFAIVVAGGFIAQPLYFILGGGNP